MFSESISNSASVQSDMVAVLATMGGKKSHLKQDDNNNIKKNIKSSSGIVTAADMYEPGFRIRNAGLCSPRTRLLVLITSAAAPAHSQNRQAIRMTWLNRYGPVVNMAFFVGTPQMSETDEVAQVLETEEQALKIRLYENNINNIEKSKKSPKPMSSESAKLVKDTYSDKVGGNSGLYQFLKNRELNQREGLDEHAMHGLNKAERAVQRILGREYGRYGDIVQCRSRDTYSNLTLKSIAALEWTREYCPWAQYLLKTDDDMFIDIHRLLRFIDKIETEAIAETGVHGLSARPREPDGFDYPSSPDFDIELPPTIWGRLAHGWRPIRQHNSKYYVSRTQYNGRVFPDFCTGPAYLMTRSAVNPLYEAALGRDFDVEDEDEAYENNNDKDKEKNQKFGKDYIDGNQTVRMNVQASTKNTVPYLKLEDVYLTGVVAERLTRRAAKRLALKERKEKDDKTTSENKNTRSKPSDIIVKVRRIHNDQFANKKITGRALERAVCNYVNPSDITNNSGFSWFRWYWGNTSVEKETKKKKKDQGVISLHMVKYFEQFDLWRRLMDGRTKCKT